MPALHEIDTDRKLITTTWSGEATDTELIDALTKYQQGIKSHPDYCSYNEIVDFSKTSDFKLSTDGLRMLVQIAAKSDVRGVKTRLAIIVGAPVAYGLARMYEVYRSLVPKVSKEVRVFRKLEDGFQWIGGNPHIDSD
jgi:hypothetical protein